MQKQQQQQFKQDLEQQIEEKALEKQKSLEERRTPQAQVLSQEEYDKYRGVQQVSQKKYNEELKRQIQEKELQQRENAEVSIYTPLPLSDCKHERRLAEQEKLAQ